MKIHQVIALHKAIKTSGAAAISAAYAIAQKPSLFAGLTRVWQKVNEDGDDMPSEKQRVQHTVDGMMTTLERYMVESIDMSAQLDESNALARADVVVDGTVILSGVLVTTLLQLEKQLVDARTFVGKLPILDEAEDWILDANSGQYRSPTTATRSTKKVETPLVLYSATPEHPAQTKTVTADVTVGYWQLTKMSGAAPKTEIAKVLGRIDALILAVKVAREAANGADAAPKKNIGAVVFSFLKV
jgi:hypothetical protein